MFVHVMIYLVLWFLNYDVITVLVWVSDMLVLFQPNSMEVEDSVTYFHLVNFYQVFLTAWLYMCDPTVRNAEMPQTWRVLCSVHMYSTFNLSRKSNMWLYNPVVSTQDISLIQSHTQHTLHTLKDKHFCVVVLQTAQAFCPGING